MKEFLIKFWSENEAFIFEAIKDAARYITFGLISWFIAYVSSLPQNTTVLLGLAILTFIDKWIHEVWKAGRTDIRGISPF